MKQAKDASKYRNFHLILFHLALVLFIWPFLGTSVLEVMQSLYIYMLLIWLFVIGLIYVMSMMGKSTSRKNEKVGDAGHV
jgi:quinol-cytochrome oxidoreductase complex cytochrome b subunit